MHDELTKVDIEKMKEEIATRRSRIPALRDEVKRTREFGDLSENDEYRQAKREYNSNNSRIRYLESMIETAVVISTGSAANEVGLFDEVTIYYPEDDEERVIRIVTTLRNDVLNDCISKESPFGRFVLGKHIGDTVMISVNPHYSYPIIIRKIKKGKDDASLPISGF